MNTLLIAHELSCFVLFFSVFCRFVNTTHKTRWQIRLTFWLLGIVGALGIAWPLMHWQMEWFGIVLAWSIIAVQWSTSYYWKNGTPHQFCIEVS